MNKAKLLDKLRLVTTLLAGEAPQVIVTGLA
jgi:hypothetical protein